MRTSRLCWSLILLAVLAHPAFSAIRPSFSLDYSSWYATHIVLVTTTPADGTFEVVESWKGDLRVGDRIVVPELRAPQTAVPISMYPKSWGEADARKVSELAPRQPLGSRMILFLKSSTGEHVPANAVGKTERGGWKPSNLMGSMKASVVWIDGDQLYGFTQPSNPGPSVFLKLPNSEAQLRNRVEEIDRIQANVTTALALKGDEERAEHLRRYVRSDVFPAREVALKGLGKSGPSAVPVISEMLDDPTFTDEASELVGALVEAGGEAVGEELKSRLQQNLAFWKSKGPSLSQGWWNDDPSIHAPLRERYELTYKLLVSLERTHYSNALDTARDLRDFWQSLPQLNDPSGLNQMVEECDRLIRKLKTDQADAR